MADRTVLISGLGIAGPALAWWLARRGFEPTLVELAPAPRRGGYMIDVWGVGFDVAERMGLIAELRRRGYAISALRLVDGQGGTIANVGGEALSSGMGDRFLSILRGDLAHLLYEQIAGQVETIFGDQLVALSQDAQGVEVRFEHAAPRRFDLVVGCDGLHSTVRRLAFGPEERYEKPLGYLTASFTVPAYSRCDENVYLSHTTPGRQLARYSLRDGAAAFFLVWIDEGAPRPAQLDLDQQKALIHERFGDMQWEAPAMLDALAAADGLYFDSVSQVHVERWSRGRIALLGDAAFCPSLLAGQGSAFAMAGAYLLAGELAAAGSDPMAAFARYEERFRAFVEKKQRAAVRTGSWFAPKTRLGLWTRNQLTRLMSLGALGGKLASAFVGDKFALPDYDEPPVAAG